MCRADGRSVALFSEQLKIASLSGCTVPIVLLSIRVAGISSKHGSRLVETVKAWNL